jgi:IS30 family transposase
MREEVMTMSENRSPYRRLDRCARDRIEQYLDLGRSLSWIAHELSFSPSTIGREVRTRRTDQGFRHRTATGNLINYCTHARTCTKTDVCTVCASARHPRCAVCKKVRCSNNCKDFVRLYCKTVTKSPYCCNACTKAVGCIFHKWRYFAHAAQRMADAEKVASRTGIDTDPATIEAVNTLIRPLLAKGQTPGQIWLTHADDIPFSRRTFYRYNELGLFGMTALELTRKAGYKRRKRRQPAESTLTIPLGHAYKDFLALTDEERTSVTELDTVMGTKHDEGSILTLHLRRLIFQIGIKLVVHDGEHAVACLDWIEGILGEDFSSVFGLGLSDRGIEFHDTDAFETSSVFPGKKRMRLYYCDARRADQKGSAERNHVELRKIIPKGTSIDHLTNYELAEVFSHVNSQPRRSLFGMSPMALAMQVLPKGFFEELGLRLVTPDEVILNPTLLA